MPNWPTKKLGEIVLITLLVIAATVSIFKFSQYPSHLNLLAFIATLVTLLWYAWETRRMAEASKKTADEILSELGNNYTYRIIGFTIFIKKWRKPQR